MFISLGFLLATIRVWVWMVCSLNSVTTGSRDRANVPLVIIIIIWNYLGLAKNEGENMLVDEVVYENYSVAEEVIGYKSALERSY